MTRAATLVAIGAITLGCRDKSSSPPAPGSSEPAKVAAPAQPALPDAAPTPTLSKPPSGEAAFAAQTRDPEWAPEAEQELRRRFGKLRGGKLEDIECRQTQCRLSITGTKGEVGDTIADLEGARGAQIRTYAKNVLLTVPEQKPDGTIVLRAFALFER